MTGDGPKRPIPVARAASVSGRSGETPEPGGQPEAVTMLPCVTAVTLLPANYSLFHPDTG